MAIECAQMEDMLADALGGELTGDRKQRFEDHIASCEACRSELARSQAALEMFRGLDGPAESELRDFQAGWTAQQSSMVSVVPKRRWGVSSGLRYAASIMIAFTAGYALHAGLMLVRPDVAPSSVPAVQPTMEATETLESALLAAYRTDPSIPRLGKCVSVVLSGKR